MTPARVLRSIAWLLLAGLIFATLSPIELRPTSPLPTGFERAFAFLLIGLVFALAYPRRIVWISVLVLGSTVLLELLQLASFTRHGRFVDVAVKLAGASAGLVAGWIFLRLRRQPSDR